MSECKTNCIACFRYEWDFFHVPDKHFTGGTPECVQDFDTEYDGETCICAAVQDFDNSPESVEK